MKAKRLYISLALFAIYSCGLITSAFIRLEFGRVIVFWVAGCFAFTLIEYLFHRYFFHLEKTTARRAKLQFIIHGNHHKKPADITGVMMKPKYALIILFLTSVLFFLLFKWNSLALLPGFLFGYSCYLFIHFAIHACKAPGNFTSTLWKLHSLHHYDDDTHNYGVSSPLWDIVLLTYQPQKKATTKK